jgi:protein O-GlcNAc transferase
MPLLMLKKSFICRTVTQVNDSSRAIAHTNFSRSELGLPEQGFIFCCFNNNFKITPDVFGVWMDLLKEVYGSVLWLLEGNPHAADNLRKEARKSGVADDRLVFAGFMPLAEHLARHRLADLFLDTMHCNAHTTASDALWAGIPVVTVTGKGFAGRVCASLLQTVGLPDLITASLAQYKNLALELAQDSHRLKELRRRVEQGRQRSALFDANLFARHLEAAYKSIWAHHLSGQAPASMHIKSIQ